ncbi:hypothetical protein D3C80_1275440 [compost metagenome]
MIRPPSALPATCARSIPLSFAILFANGDAFTRSPLPDETGASSLATAAFSAIGASALLSAAGLAGASP